MEETKNDHLLQSSSILIILLENGGNGWKDIF